jgi:hypothetical protein
MSEIINLNKKRKAMARTEKEARAVENRVKYGRTKQEKLSDKVKAEKLERHLQAHQREATED